MVTTNIFTEFDGGPMTKTSKKNDFYDMKHKKAFQQFGFILKKKDEEIAFWKRKYFEAAGIPLPSDLNIIEDEYKYEEDHTMDSTGSQIESSVEKFDDVVVKVEHDLDMATPKVVVKCQSRESYNKQKHKKKKFERQKKSYSEPMVVIGFNECATLESFGTQDHKGINIKSDDPFVKIQTSRSGRIIKQKFSSDELQHALDDKSTDVSRKGYEVKKRKKKNLTSNKTSWEETDKLAMMKKISKDEVKFEISKTLTDIVPKIVPIKKQKCRLCMDNIYSHSTNHMEEHHGPDYVNQCPLCTELNINNLKEHMDTKHFNIKRFQCIICSKIFYTELAYTKHKITHDLVRKYQCISCMNYFINIESLEEHMKTFERGSCQQRKEMKMKFTEVCDLCGEEFKSTKTKVKDLIKTHKLDVHGLLSIPCPHCNASFSNKTLWKAHVRIHDNYSPFLCKYPSCRRQFKTILRLRAHEVFHKPPSFTCDKCDAKYFMKVTWKKHVEQCTGEAPARLKPKKLAIFASEENYKDISKDGESVPNMTLYSTIQSDLLDILSRSAETEPPEKFSV